MRIPFPERIPIDRVALFAVALFVIQWLEGTALYFSVWLRRLHPGRSLRLQRRRRAYPGFGRIRLLLFLLVVIVGVCYKAFLGEPGQSNLLDPRTTIEVYVGSITAMLAAVIVSSRFPRKSGLLQNLLKDSQMYRASVGCIVFGVVGGFIIALLGESALGWKLPSASSISSSRWASSSASCTKSAAAEAPAASICPFSSAPSTIFLFFGVLGFSKQGMLLPLVCWFFPVCALRFRLSVRQVLSMSRGCLRRLLLPRPLCAIWARSS